MFPEIKSEEDEWRRKTTRILVHEILIVGLFFSFGMDSEYGIVRT